MTLSTFLKGMDPKRHAHGAHQRRASEASVSVDGLKGSKRSWSFVEDEGQEGGSISCVPVLWS